MPLNNMMRIEHFAYQVADAPAVAQWYCDHLGFTIKRASTGVANTHFLADGSGKVMIEIYNNPTVDVPDYAAMHPLLLHIAFVCDEIDETVEALEAAGATIATPAFVSGLGDSLAMLRDPWGLAIQLCKRANPMV